MRPYYLKSHQQMIVPAKHGTLSEHPLDSSLQVLDHHLLCISPAHQDFMILLLNKANHYKKIGLKCLLYFIFFLLKNMNC